MANGVSVEDRYATPGKRRQQGGTVLGISKVYYSWVLVFPWQ